MSTENISLKSVISEIGSLAQSVGAVSQEDIETKLTKQWKRLVDKGDLGKIEDCPGEIADCLIATLWLANLQGITLRPIGDAKETQQSVSAWCDEHYPGEDLSDRTKDLIEELTELAVCSGISESSARGSLIDSFNKTNSDSTEQVYERVLSALEKHALQIGVEWDAVLDEKMAKNRQKTTDESQSRLQSKLSATNEG